MDRNQALALYRQMLLIRRFEERCAQLYVEGKIGGFLHLYIGQEAVGVGAISQMRADDYLIAYYRDHGYALARGADPRLLLAELCGKFTGISRGKGGSMHFYDVPAGNFGGDGIVGGHLPIAAGIGYGIRLRGTDQVCLCFFGDGADQRGRLPRGAQRQRSLGPARRLHHREQPLRHGHVHRPRLVGQGPLPARLRLRSAAPRGQRHGRRGRAQRAWARPSSARARRSGPPSSRPRPTAIAATPCPTRASTGPRKKSSR